jgi:uncharacterized protein DUF4157
MKLRSKDTRASEPSRPRSPFFSPGLRRGDRAVPFFQPKLRIGEAGDPFEREADRVADQVVTQGNAPSVQTMGAGCAVDGELRRQPGEGRPEPAGAGLEQRLSASQGEGRPLPSAVERSMGTAFGHDFSSVRVHTGGPAVQLNRDLDAEAFTHGNHVYFNAGNFAPDSAAGRRLLAHELTHVVQQGFAGAAPMIQREDKKKEEKDPLGEGLKITAEKALEKPEVKAALKGLWESVPEDSKLGLMTFAGVNLGFAYLGLALSSQMREELSGTDIAKPLSLIPYNPLESFKYKLPEAGKTATGFSLEFNFEDYFELLRKSAPGVPISNFTFGLDTSYSPEGGLSLTGGKFGLDFLSGALKARFNTFTSLSPYPMLLPGRPGEPPSTLMQSVPGLPPIETGPGAQFMLSADLLKLFPGLKKVF